MPCWQTSAEKLPQSRMKIANRQRTNKAFNLNSNFFFISFGSNQVFKAGLVLLYKYRT